jgi:hypothetical protein
MTFDPSMANFLSSLLDDTKRIQTHLSNPSEPGLTGERPRLNRVTPPPAPNFWKPATFALAFLSVALLVGYVAFLNPLRSENARLAKQNHDLDKQLSGIEEENRKIVEKIEAERDQIKTALEASKKENETVRLAMQKADLQLKGYEEEKIFLEDILIHKTKEIESLKKTAPADGAAPSGTSEQLKDKQADLDKLAGQNRQLSHKLDDLYKVTNDQLNLIAAARAGALEQTIADARKKIDDVWSSVDLGTLTVDQHASSPAPAAAKNEGPRKIKNEGRILAINEEHGFVVIDMGKVDNVSPDSQFAVVRGKDRIASLSAMEIRDVMTACSIRDVKNGIVLEVDDKVVLQK